MYVHMYMSDNKIRVSLPYSFKSIFIEFPVNSFLSWLTYFSMRFTYIFPAFRIREEVNMGVRADRTVLHFSPL